MGDEGGIVTEIEVYRQQSARFLNLNDTLYKIPPIFATVIGGLWYFAATQMRAQTTVSVGVLLFAAAVGLAGGNSLVQLRKATNGYLDQIERFEAKHLVTLKPPGESPHRWRVSTVRGLTYLLFFSVILSVLGAVVLPLLG